jgi:membrane protease YdiL (CAAX protease family)
LNPFKKSTPRWIAIAIAIAIPTVVTYIYFVVLAHSAPKLQQTAYSTGKVIQFAFPLVWVLFFLKQKIGNSGLPVVEDAARWSRGTSIGFGVGMGLAVSVAMFVIYRMLPAQAVDDLSLNLQQRVKGLGVASPVLFLGLGVFYALIHSFMEEYYFRWFIFGQLRHVTKFVPAMIISGLAFMGHHVIVIGHYFGAMHPLTIFLSACIAVGGLLWAWQYEKSQSLVGPWISHLIVDAGIFAVGYHILFVRTAVP